jgi:hypothetical protein
LCATVSGTNDTTRVTITCSTIQALVGWFYRELAIKTPACAQLAVFAGNETIRLARRV